MKGEIVVVGGGLGGLAAAAYLARAGLQVRVLEKAEHLGGRARTQNHEGKGGRFSFNLGPHALYRHGPAEEVLRELGVPIEGEMPSSSGALALSDDKTFMLPAGPFSLLATGLLPAGAKLEIGKLLASLQRIDAAALTGTTVAAWLEATVETPGARALAEALVRVSTYTNAPRLFDAGVAVAQLQRVAKYNVLYLHHGWQPLVDALQKIATAAGAVIEGGAKVKRVLVEGGRASGVELEGGRRVEAAAVIVAASPMIASKLFGDVASLARAAELAVPIEAACLDVGLSRLPRPRHNFLLGIDSGYYASVHSAIVDVAPPGAATVHVARYLAPGEAPPPESELLAVLEQLQPGATELIVERRYLPKITVMHDAISAARGGLAGRPPVRVGEIENAAIVGDWVGPEGLLADASLGSARAAARLLTAASARSEATA